MRCPKCQYISFDSGDRCRNCGYEFALTVEAPDLDLPIQTGDEAIGPLGDLALADGGAPLTPAPGPDASSRYTPPNGGMPVRGPVPPPRAPTPVRTQPPTPSARTPERRPGTGPLELPLFNDRGFDDDRPLVTPPAVPRAPLSVRRSGPPMPRAHARTAVDEPELDLEMPAAPSAAPSRDGGVEVRETADADESSSNAAKALPRLAAGLVDLILLAAIDASVLYFALLIIDFDVPEILLLPRVPLLGFLILLNGGYFVAFTAAGGQTIGKMLAGIKVVPAHDAAGSDRVPFGQAALRTVAYLVSALPAGLGYLPALISKDRRAIHDRLADTRVIQA